MTINYIIYPESINDYSNSKKSLTNKKDIKYVNTDTIDDNNIIKNNMNYPISLEKNDFIYNEYNLINPLKNIYNIQKHVKDNHSSFNNSNSAILIKKTRQMNFCINGVSYQEKENINENQSKIPSDNSNTDKSNKENIDFYKVYSLRQRYSPRKYRIEREAIKQFETIVNYGNGNNNENNGLLRKNQPFKLKLKKDYEIHDDLNNNDKNTLYKNSVTAKFIGNREEENINNNTTSDDQTNSKSTLFHKKLQFNDNNILFKSQYTNLSEFKSYLINYGKKYGIQKLKKVLYEQFFNKIYDKKPKLNAFIQNSEDNYGNNINSSENTLNISNIYTDLLNELEQEIEKNSNDSNHSFLLNKKGENINQCVPLTETNILYNELVVKKNNNSAPPPSTLLLQCSDTSRTKKNEIDKSIYHPKFDRKTKEELLKKKFKNISLNDSVGLIHDKNSCNSINSIDINEYDSYDKDINLDSEQEHLNKKFNEKQHVDPYEIMNYKVKMYNNKRKHNIERSKINEKVKENEEEFPVFKDFLYPRWYQHQKYYTNENECNLKGLGGLYGVNLSEDENDSDQIKDIYIDNKTLKKIIERKNIKQRYASINDDDDDSQDSKDSFDIDPKDQILNEIEIVKKDLINLRKKNKALWNCGHPRQNNFHYPSQDESIKYWSWKKRHPENAAILLQKRQKFKIQYEQKIRKMIRLFELIKVLKQPDYININKIRNEERYYGKRKIKPKSPPPFSVNGKKYLQYEPTQFLSSHIPKDETKIKNPEKSTNDINLNSRKSIPKIKSQYIRMNFSNALPEKINNIYYQQVSKDANYISNSSFNNTDINKTDYDNKTNDRYYTLFDTNHGIKEAFDKLSWKKIESCKYNSPTSNEFKRIFHLNSNKESNELSDNNTATNKKIHINNINNEIKNNKNNEDSNSSDDTTFLRNEGKRESNYTKLRNKEIHDNSIAIHASVVDANRKECLPMNKNLKNSQYNSQYKSQYKSRSLSTRSINRSRSSKSLSSLSSSNHLYDYNKLNDPNYMENLKYKYRHDPVGKKTLLELLRGTYVRNINDDENGIFYNSSSIDRLKLKQSSINDNNIDTEKKQTKTTGNEKSSNIRIVGVDKSPIEEKIDEFSRKKGRLLNVEQMKEVLLDEKINKLENRNKILEPKAATRKASIIDNNKIASNSRRNHFYKQLEKMNNKYNDSAYAMFDI
ncbi:hypothetical protein BCR36DRAFT_408548 [Piromyces finnis]|uniref:Uncharacterized protein n=1 Tax=Piromyces finnis TaxID=1754191 RepID=A0A1Y1VP96_9FUNG|nr:hypothetical protein BCR36DRAFT_408548 [Piromyces finnis]|eukprot:ORX60190.1 hypothetical protein BCR36DRAFT_408548 [Piromyces finnis]